MEHNITDSLHQIEHVLSNEYLRKLPFQKIQCQVKHEHHLSYDILIPNIDQRSSLSYIHAFDEYLTSMRELMDEDSLYETHSILLV
ncbi:hypothetical protein D3C74_289970 [compost metagenome]